MYSCSVHRRGSYYSINPYANILDKKIKLYFFQFKLVSYVFNKPTAILSSKLLNVTSRKQIVFFYVLTHKMRVSVSLQMLIIPPLLNCYKTLFFPCKVFHSYFPLHKFPEWTSEVWCDIADAKKMSVAEVENSDIIFVLEHFNTKEDTVKWIVTAVHLPRIYSDSCR